MKKAIKTLFRGLWRTLFGAALACGIAVSGYGYAMIPTESGYGAVAIFLACTVGMASSLMLMWALGHGSRHHEEDR